MSILSSSKFLEFELENIIKPCYFVNEFGETSIIKKTRKIKKGERLTTRFYSIKIKDTILSLKKQLEKYDEGDQMFEQIKSSIKVNKSLLKYKTEEDKVNLSNFLLSLKSGANIS